MIGLETASTLQRHKPNRTILRVREVWNLGQNSKDDPSGVNTNLEERPRQLRS